MYYTYILRIMYTDRTFIHTFYLTNEYYFKDYENVRKRRFRAKKTQLEKAVTTKICAINFAVTGTICCLY